MPKLRSCPRLPPGGIVRALGAAILRLLLLSEGFRGFRGSGF